MEKNNEQGKGWEDIAIPGFEQAPPLAEEAGEAMTEAARNTIADIFIIVEAWKILAPLKGKAAGPVDPDLKNALQHLEKGNASYEIKINALFTGLSGQGLEEAEALSPDQIKELKAYFYRLDEFIFEGLKDPDATIGRLIFKFLKREQEKCEPVNEFGVDYNLPEVPKRYRIWNDKLSKWLRGDIIKAGDNQLVINSGGIYLTVINNPAIDVWVDVYTSQKDKLSRKLSPLEIQVFCYLASVWIKEWDQAKKENRRIRFPSYDVESAYKFMSGGADKPSQKMKKDIAAAFDLFGLDLKITIECSDLIKQTGGNPDILSSTITGIVFPAIRRDDVMANNHKPVSRWYARDIPPFIAFNEMLDQITSMPASLLNIPGVSMTVPRMAMRDYMARRIMDMRQDIKRAQTNLRKWKGKAENKDKGPEEIPKYCKRAMSDRILYSAIFAATGKAMNHREKIDRAREFCRIVLDSWKGRFIKDYTEDETGITIIHRYVP